tara:strand:- start:20382 stop:21353 length:972 start_codon:yes stop_codon:yes gene_type:complete
MWDDIKNIIDSNHSFVISSHVNPDGDSVGSALALFECLKALGKDVVVAMSDSIPTAYRWLDPEEDILAPVKESDLELISSSDVIFIVDANAWNRLGGLKESLEKSEAVKVVIDHHPYTKEIAPYSVIETKLSSTAELIYDLVDSMNVPITARAADALYTGILTDTGSFRYARKNPCAHHIAAKLISLGVDPSRIYDQVYNHNSEVRTRLMGKTYADIRITDGGEIAWLIVTKEMVRQTGASPSDTSGFVDVTMTITGIKIGIIFVEAEDGRIQISLRSRPETDVNQIAVKLGGGGHKNAAGVLFTGTIEEAVKTVIEVARTAV